MKAKKLHEWQEDQAGLPNITCYICQKKVKGAYGWTELGDELAASCSAKCEQDMSNLREKRHDAFPVSATKTNQHADVRGIPKSV